MNSTLAQQHITQQPNATPQHTRQYINQHTNTRQHHHSKQQHITQHTAAPRHSTQHSFRLKTLTVRCGTWRTPWRSSWVLAGFDHGCTGKGPSHRASHTDPDYFVPCHPSAGATRQAGERQAERQGQGRVVQGCSEGKIRKKKLLPNHSNLIIRKIRAKNELGNGAELVILAMGVCQANVNSD